MLNKHEKEITELKEKVARDEKVIEELSELVKKKTFLSNDNLLSVARTFAILFFVLIMAFFKEDILIKLAEIIFK